MFFSYIGKQWRVQDFGKGFIKESGAKSPMKSKDRAPVKGWGENSPQNTVCGSQRQKVNRFAYLIANVRYLRFLHIF